MAESFSTVLVSIVILVTSIFVRVSHSVAPLFTGLPISLSVGENENTNRILYTLTVTDPNGDSFTCSVTIDTGSFFQIIRDPETAEWKIWTNSPSFNVNTANSYNITVTCTDAYSASTTGIIYVNVLAGDAIKFSNLPTTVSKTALNTEASTQIFDVNAVDDSGDILTYYMTVSPSTVTSFQIDASTGIVTTTRELKYETQGTTTLLIRATDGRINVTEKLVVTLTNMNTVPMITNLPTTKTVSESTAGGTTLFTLSTYDPDSGATKTTAFSLVSAASASHFTLDSNGNFKLATGKSLDYETTTFYNVSFTVNDGMATGGPYFLLLYVENDNEPCSFGNTMYYASTDEGAAGSASMSPGFKVSDPDAGATWTYHLYNANNSDRFTIDSSTGSPMGFAVNYDVDNNAMPSKAILTVLCKDNGGTTGVIKSGSTQITITINDVNDNYPTFSASSYTIYADQYDDPGTVLGSLTVTDADSGSNALFTCTATSTSTNSATYSVNSDCSIYLAKTISFDYGTIVTYIVKAVDQGTTPLTGTTTLNVVYRLYGTTTVTTTTTTQYNFFSRAENIAVFSLLLITALVLIAFLLYICVECCWGSLYCCNACNGGYKVFSRGCECCRSVNRPSSLRKVIPHTPETPLTPAQSIKSIPYKEDNIPPPQPYRSIRYHNGTPAHNGWL
ncbi:hypothetical protein CHS0354_035522 [Potamilus streckersoni]|uniref:Cadherin domain-containing protein n=1 Tax=Potamilus streckersoni TaxID=2493646 RepID=A0AAE0RSN1_9BIVA|nr:hypothetical protein CHS0354_035522 [Potamilus streckersoni]